jgi:hypothetical protein
MLFFILSGGALQGLVQGLILGALVGLFYLIKKLPKFLRDNEHRRNEKSIIGYIAYMYNLIKRLLNVRQRW